MSKSRTVFLSSIIRNKRSRLALRRMVSIRMWRLVREGRRSLILFLLFSFWDERFLFECDDKSDQIHLRIIDRKTTNMKMGAGFGSSILHSIAFVIRPWIEFLVDSIYADVFIPFSYVTSTVYKKDVQISPQYPESIIRIEVRRFSFILFARFSTRSLQSFFTLFVRHMRIRRERATCIYCISHSSLFTWSS